MVDLSSVDLPTLQTWRTQALANLAAFQNGQKVVSAAYAQGNGSRSVTYSAATIDTTLPWLSGLEKEIARRTGSPYQSRRRAIGVRFG